jgi:hypothetical protein
MKPTYQICAIVALAVLVYLFLSREKYAPVCQLSKGFLGFGKKQICNYCGVDTAKLLQTGSLTEAERNHLSNCPDFLSDCNDWIQSQGPDYARAIQQLPNWKSACFRDGPKIHDLFSRPADVKTAAKELLNTSNEKRYDYLCNIVVSESQDPATYQQYLDMKKRRPKAEVNNLCGNISKIILSKK